MELRIPYHRKRVFAVKREIRIYQSGEKSVMGALLRQIADGTVTGIRFGPI